ncbi:universal stress protein [Flavobacterium paronense]|nr:universal stress protein [Flavobacterium paronense]MDN3675960.1 universal stress protein [Flavobacterium paronense]
MPNKGSYKNILVAVDGSTASNIAFKEAIYIAKRNNAKLYVAQVINNKLNYLPKNRLIFLLKIVKIYSKN